MNENLLKSKHILYPIGSFYPSQAGGPSNSIYWISQALVKAGARVTVVTTNEGICPEHQVSLNKYHDVNAIKVIYTRTRIHQLPVKLIYETIKVLPTADIVHLNSVMYLPSIIIATLCILYKKQLVWSTRGEVDQSAIKYSNLYSCIYLQDLYY